MAKLRLFQLEGGSHQEGVGTKVFNKGDYIKSTRDLRKLFPNKFRLIEHDLITQEMLKSIEQAAKSDEDEEEYVAPAVIKGESEYIGDVSDDEPEVSIDDELTAGEDEEPEDVEEEEVEERPKKKRRKVARS